MTGPLVSVIIPCYNYGLFVTEAVESVLQSTYRNVEILVVDDGSTDAATLEVLEELPPRYENVTVIRQENKGLPSARNTGIRHAKGTYLLPLDADDRIDPTFLMKALWHLERYPESGFVYSLVQLFGDVDELWMTEDFCQTFLLHHNYIPATALLRRELWESAGGYDEQMRDGYEDWEFWIRASSLGWKGLRIAEPLFLYRKHGHSMIADARQKHDQIVRYIRSKHRNLYDLKWRLDLYRRSLFRKGGRVARKGLAFAKESVPEHWKKRLRTWYRQLRPVSVMPLPPFQARGDALVCTDGGGDGRIGLLIVAPWLQVGGVESVFLTILSELDASKYRVHVVTTLAHEHPWTSRFELLAERVLHLAHVCRSEQDMVDFLTDYIRSNDISCIHVSNSQFLYRYAPVLKQVAPEITIFDTLHMEEPQEPWDYFRFATPFQGSLDFRVVITNSLKDRLVRLYGETPERVLVIENGIDLSAFAADEFDFSQREEIFFVGRFVDQKQPLRFVDIAARLLRFDGSLRFVMVGDGPLFQDVRARVSELKLCERIELLGSRRDVAQLLGARAKVMVAPSVREGLPMIGLEAMALGVPIVASNVIGWNDLIDSGTDGVLVPEENLDSYTDAILDLLRHPSTLREMGKKAHDKVHAFYSATSMAERYTKLYESSQMQVVAGAALKEDAK